MSPSLYFWRNQYFISKSAVDQGKFSSFHIHTPSNIHEIQRSSLFTLKQKLLTVMKFLNKQERMYVHTCI
jgi:hypothetical protein